MIRTCTRCGSRLDAAIFSLDWFGRCIDCQNELARLDTATCDECGERYNPHKDGITAGTCPDCIFERHARYAE